MGRTSGYVFLGVGVETHTTDPVASRRPLENVDHVHPFGSRQGGRRLLNLQLEEVLQDVSGKVSLPTSSLIFGCWTHRSSNHSFTWLNSRYQPVEIPAYEYLTLVQRYISGKIDDGTIFPTDAAGVSYADNPAFCTPVPESGQDWVGKRSGFPQNFMETCQTIFRQMFRVYAHLYWSHFDDMFSLNLEKSMNSCFSHFILTATTLNLLKKSDLEPMQPLIDLWAALGTFPQGSKAFEIANLQVGQLLVQKAGGPPAN